MVITEKMKEKIKETMKNALTYVSLYQTEESIQRRRKRIHNKKKSERMKRLRVKKEK